MSILKQVISDLVGMFLKDARLTITILVLVAAVAFLIRDEGLTPLTGGWLLLGGSLALLVISVLRASGRD